MSYHLDSNVVIGILNGRQPDYRRRFDRARDAGENVFLSSVVVFELWYGVAKGDRVKSSAQALRLFLDTLDDVLPFTSEEAVAAGEIRATLKTAGTPIGPYDLLIAAHAQRHGATLVTANMREFSRVPGLALEDWSKPL